MKTLCPCLTQLITRSTCDTYVCRMVYWNMQSKSYQQPHRAVHLSTCCSILRQQRNQIKTGYVQSTSLRVLLNIYSCKQRPRLRTSRPPRWKKMHTSGLLKGKSTWKYRLSWIRILKCVSPSREKTKVFVPLPSVSRHHVDNKDPSDGTWDHGNTAAEWKVRVCLFHWHLYRIQTDIWKLRFPLVAPVRAATWH